MLPEQIIIAPVVTEKAVELRAASRYVFKVQADATKIDIAGAVRALFKVKVERVNTSQVRAKKRVRGTVVGRTSNWKKAYVTLAAGQKIEELAV